MFGTKLPIPSRYPDNQPGPGRVGHGQVASAASQSQPKPDEQRTRTDQNKASEHVSFLLLIFPHRSRLSLSLSPRPRDAVGTHAQAHGPPRCHRRGSPEMDGSGSWDAIDWNQIEVRPPPLPPRLPLPPLARSRATPAACPPGPFACVSARLSTRPARVAGARNSVR